MKKKRKKTVIPPHLEAKLNEAEYRAAERGITVHYDLMEAAGLKLNGGLCRIHGQYHLFIDRRASAAERIAAIQTCLDRPPADMPPETEEMQDIEKDEPGV